LEKIDHKLKMILASFFWLSSCHRTDALSVIDNPAGPGVIVDNMYGDDQRFICVISSVTEHCTKNTASVVVGDVKEFGDIQVGWSADGIAKINILRGRLIHAEPTALGGSVKIAITQQIPDRPQNT